MQKWEYMHLFAQYPRYTTLDKEGRKETKIHSSVDESINLLNEFGVQGWEVITQTSISGGNAFLLKRPIE